MGKHLFLASILQFLILAPVGGEELPPLDFVRGLVAKGKSTRALEYLQQLAQNPPAGLAPLLPLEMGRAHVAMAVQTSNKVASEMLRRQAREELTLFLRKNGDHPLAADAVFQLARLSGLEAKALAKQARQEEDPRRKVGQMIRARYRFEEADKQFVSALAKIDANIKTGRVIASGDLHLLAEVRTHAALEQGINFLEEARTLGESDSANRTELLRKATSVLDSVSREDSKNPLCWEAMAWLGRCQLENDDPRAARKVLSELIVGTNDARDNGKRLGRYFMILVLAKDSESKNTWIRIQQMAEEWLRLYSTYRDTPEGLAVRVHLANSYYALAKNSRTQGKARELLQRAFRLYQDLEDPVNDYTALARNNKLQIAVALFQEKPHGKIDELQNFQECYLRAHVEMDQLASGAKSSSSDVFDEERKKIHYRNIIQSLTRALDLANKETPEQDLNDARCLLVYAYLEVGDYEAAAATGEQLARTVPSFSRSAEAGVYALQACALLLSKEQKAASSSNDLASNRYRVQLLAQYIESQWPDSPAADNARHILGLMFLGINRYADAVDALERIRPGYADAARALHQLGWAAWQAHLEGIKTRPGKPAYAVQAEAVLTGLAAGPASTGPAGMREHFSAKRLLAKLYYSTRQYEKLQSLADGLQKRPAPDDSSSEERATMEAISLYASLSDAEREYESGNYGKACTLLDTILDTFRDSSVPSLVADLEEKDPELVDAVFGLALRANVQAGKMDRGKAILKQLQKQCPKHSRDILLGQAARLRAQIERKRHGGMTDKGRLNEAVAVFSGLLDEWSKQQGLAANPDLKLFLAQSYASLGKHEQAAKLAGSIPESLPESGNEDTQSRRARVYHIAQLLRARELRLNGDYVKAQAALEAIGKTAWGKQSLEVKKDEILLLEDREQYVGRGAALARWNELMSALKPHLEDKKTREQYFDCYFHLTYCIYKNALKIRDGSSRQNWVRKAASYALRLQSEQDAAAQDCKKRLGELLLAEPLLRKEYEELKQAN
jgi:TolA-binding protein